MKSFLVVHVFWAFCCIGTIEAIGGKENNDAGLELLLSAIKKQGDNPSVVHSGIIEVVITKNKKIDEEEYKRDLQSLKDEYANMLRTAPKDSEDYVQLLASIKTADIDYRDVYLRRNKTKDLYRIVFRGTPPYSDVKQEIFDLTDTEKQISSEIEPSMKVIGNNVDRFGRSMYLWYNKGLGNNFVVEQNYGVPFVNQLGRVRGQMFMKLTALLLYGGTEKQLNNFEFNKEVVNAWREANHKLIQKDKDAAVHIFREENTPEGRIYGVIMPGLNREVTKSRNVVSRFPERVIIWINPEKGHVTPLIEEYFEDVCIKRYESRYYFLMGNSGIWYPRESIETDFDKKGEQISQTTYDVNIEKSAINIEISDDEFVFPVPAGWTITDRQSVIHNSYRAVRNTKLKFEKGRIALRGNRDFIAEGGTPVNLMVGNDWFMRMFCIVIGAVLVLFVLISLYKKAKSSKV
ncbi:MAG: hypothetical protein LBC74_03885 [Planctomycetaceae bacterium]|nr:hypothetical protein [Planctomycetaceae bacterium]